MTSYPVRLRSVNIHETEREVQIEWGHEGPQSIYIHDNWQERLSPADLIQEILQEISRHCPSSQMRQARLSDVHLDDLREYALLLEEAREERKDRYTPPQAVRSEHFATTWSNGHPLEVTCSDMEWMISAPRQALVDELIVACTPPEPKPIGPAENRLARFLNKRGTHD